MAAQTPKTRDRIVLRAVEMLSDGEWHHFGETLRKLALLVEPGIAVRRAEAERRRVAASRGRPMPDRKRARSVADIVEIGATNIVRKKLHDRARGPTAIFEITPGRDREAKLIRLRT